MSHPDPHHDPENIRIEDSKFAPKQKLRVQKSKIAKRMNDGKAPKDKLGKHPNYDYYQGAISNETLHRFTELNKWKPKKLKKPMAF